MAAWLAVGLGAILAVSAVLGRAELGSAVALGFVLTAVPSLPTTMRPALATMGIRGAAVLAGAVLAVLCAGHPVALGAATIAAAVCGALLDRVGPTAGLAVVLVAVDAHDELLSPTTLVPYLVGGLVVVAVWSAWSACARALAAARRETPQDAVEFASTLMARVHGARKSGRGRRRRGGRHCVVASRGSGGRALADHQRAAHRSARGGGHRNAARATSFGQHRRRRDRGGPAWHASVGAGRRGRDRDLVHPCDGAAAGQLHMVGRHGSSCAAGDL